MFVVEEMGLIKEGSGMKWKSDAFGRPVKLSTVEPGDILIGKGPPILGNDDPIRVRVLF